MKTGILGGTFDPIHIGHLLLAEAAYEAAGLDRVILLPTGRSYFKDGTGVTDAGRRLAMVRLAAQGNRHLEVLDIEVRRPGKTYTSDTLQELSKCFPEDELFCAGISRKLFFSLRASLWKQEVMKREAVKWRLPPGVFGRSTARTSGCFRCGT